MTNRIIKFRAFNLSTNQMEFSEELYIPSEWREGSHQIMQFTGLLDKNGKEIYEGDIMTNRNKTVYWEVSFTKNRWRLGNFGLSESQIRVQGWEEIVDNIFVNPELLNSPRS